MRLDSQQANDLRKAMVAAFTPDELHALLVDYLASPVHQFTSIYKPIPAQILDIYGHFDRHNTSERLVAALRDARPNVPTFVRIADQLGMTTAPPSSALEVLIARKEAPFQNVIDFRMGLARIEDAVCRIEASCLAGTAKGTGILIGKSTVLTNQHVVARALDANSEMEGKITCHFDFKDDSQGSKRPSPSVEVRAVRLSSPPAQEDYDPHKIATNPSLLDYAVLELDQDFADEPIVPGGLPRGFIAIQHPITVPAVGAALLIFQHPKGGPMKIDLGSVDSSTGIRIRHNVNTAPGSSGAPVFDASLKLVALHHAGHEWPSADYPFNQAIPLALVVEHARTAGIAL